ncbi:ORMDL-domain-containing protein [Athelia psychrophila]|uniref:ORMDL-domain-containing protein n=1 Tax=Athelia psychrophila TaxID=1759441 RepID=A0A167SYU8_9AGAM|nr:ORMDL-domain-containing protein [Fibularhizoctonia sp. CBS 109695]
MNANWVNAKGAWAIHWVLIAVGKLILDNIPGMTTQISWTMLSLSYFSLTYLMFHWVTGVPFDSELHGGAYDDLTMWEQIDDGAQYTPAKKWLLSVPIILFLASTHYTNYNPWTFAINLTALILISIVPKLPALHRQRLRFMTDGTPAGTPSGSRAPSRQNSRAPSRQNSRQVSPTRSIR